MPAVGWALPHDPSDRRTPRVHGCGALVKSMSRLESNNLTTCSAPVHKSYQDFVAQGAPKKRGTSGRKGGADSRTMLIGCCVPSNHLAGL